MSEIKLKIDGREIIAASGDTILTAAQKNGIEIPTLCYENSISHNTSCFVCIVKDEKNNKWLPSCSAEAYAGMEISSSSEAVKDMRKTSLELLLSEHIGDCEAPCTIACPAHAPVEEYVRAGREGDLKEALKIVKERIPLPLSIGRVCPRFCEKDCRRNVLDQAVAINDVKRLAADLYYEEYLEDLPPLTDKKVAIIGSGPGGLATAYFLRLEGIGSVIYEKLPKPGGMLRYGIPEYRLPKTILDKEIAHFEKLGGIEIKCNQELGTDLDLKQLKAEYDAVVISVGSWVSSGMRTPGEELAANGIEWLEELAHQDWQGDDPGETVVLGGGNTAMDCVRSSVRLTDKNVYCLYRRTEKEMPAEQIEIDEAREEGVQFRFLTQPIGLRKEGEKLILTCLQMELGEPDASGRRRPVPIEGSEFEFVADTVIAAIGQKTKAPEGLPLNKWGDVDVEEISCSCGDNLFAAGDCVSGPATVVEAVAGARRAALGIKAFFENTKSELPYQINVSRGQWQGLAKNDLVYLKEAVEKDRVPQRHISIEDRVKTFKEVSATFTPLEIKIEGDRCIECSCTARDDCKLKQQSEDYVCDKDKFAGEKVYSGYDVRHQDIILDRGKCIRCGICVKVCKDVVNESILGFKNRGYLTTIDTGLAQPLPQFCLDCGKCLETCPVGALDWKNKLRAKE